MRLTLKRLLCLGETVDRDTHDKGSSGEGLEGKEVNLEKVAIVAEDKYICIMNRILSGIPTLKALLEKSLRVTGER